MTAIVPDILLDDEAATVRLGEDIAMALRPGDVVALEGDLGAGKTTLARSIIRALAADGDLEVPSPTFTLVQHYPGRVPVDHFDLYRIASADDLEELGFGDTDAASLVEWPDRAPGLLPPETLTLALAHHGSGRIARLSGTGALAGRIARSLEIRDFLDRHLQGARRRYLQGDASARSYEIVSAGDASAPILMNAPRMPDGPPVRDGKPYSQIAHLAESVAPFVAIDAVLRDAGICAPAIHASDLERGLLLIEHLGDAPFLEAGKPVAARYALAAELLAAMHAKQWPDTIDLGGGVAHRVPAYDREAMQIEVDLLLDWYLPAHRPEPATQEERGRYRQAWAQVFDRLEKAEKTLVLRDFHSPNLIWREERQGLDRVGVIDFQDAVIGPSAYDVASLAQDARVTIPAEMEAATVAAYVAARRRQPGFEEAAFRESYAIMAAQRNAKILGIFVRLHRRDGKPQYLAHLPRIRDYLARSLQDPALAEVKDFLAQAGVDLASRS